MTGNDIVKAARECIDVPFVHQGRTRKGLDCVGLCIFALAKVGVPINDVKGYSRNPTGFLKDKIEGQPRLSRVKEMQPGDFLLMRFKREPQHVAVFAGQNIIHSYQTVGKVVEHVFSSEWQKRVLAIYRVVK